MKEMNKNIFIGVCFIGSLLAGCSSKKDEGSLQDFSGHVTEITKQLLKVTDYTGKCITFDNRKSTYVSNAIMVGDSVNVSYKGKLDNGTVAIIVEFVSKK